MTAAALTSTQNSILTALKDGQRLHLFEVLKASTCNSYPEVQAVLAGLLQSGLIVAQWDEDRARVYQISEQGRQALCGEPPAQPFFLAWMKPG